VKPTVRQPEHWHPHEIDLIAEFARATGLRPDLEDQLKAAMLDS
jgi:hypothetical protein